MAERNLGIGMDFSPNSEYALNWGLAHLTREGDNVIAIFVNTCYAEDRGDAFLWKDNGTPLIPLEEIAEANVRGMYGMKWNAVVVKEMRRAAVTKHLKIVVKVYWGDPGEKLCTAAKDIPLHLLIVGGSELGTLKRIFVGSVSHYVANNAVCPVTVVKERVVFDCCTVLSRTGERSTCIPSALSNKSTTGKCSLPRASAILKLGICPLPWEKASL